MTHARSRLSLAVKMGEKVSGKISGILSQQESEALNTHARRMTSNLHKKPTRNRNTSSSISTNPPLLEPPALIPRRASLSLGGDTSGVTGGAVVATGAGPETSLKKTASELINNKDFIKEYVAHQARVKKKMDNILTPFSGQAPAAGKDGPSAPKSEADNVAQLITNLQTKAMGIN